MAEKKKHYAGKDSPRASCGARLAPDSPRVTNSEEFWKADADGARQHPGEKMSETGIQKITPCRLCQRNYTTRGISRHLRSCIPQNAQGSGETLHLTVQAGLYQMELALQPTCTFGELDRFLRKIWLECCKHISKFVIDGENFRKMKTPIAERSSPGAWFEHVYDAGSSTTLRIKENPRQPGLFAAILDGCTMPRTPGIRIIARNLMPELCACGGAAEFITDADWDQVYDQDDLRR